MSRVGKEPIKIENNVQVEVNEGGEYNHKEITVKGPKGELKQSIRKGVDVEVKDGEVVFTRANDSKRNRSFHGLYRSLVSNMIEGVTNGYSKELELVGVGYRAKMAGNDLELSLELTHPVIYKAPEGITFEVTDSVNVKVSGINKQLVGETAAQIRALRKPEPYKGKGVRYKGEQVRRKAGKAAISSSS